MRPTLKRCSRQLWRYAGVAWLTSGLACDSGAGEEPALRGIPAECTVLEPGEPGELAADAHVIAYEGFWGGSARSLTRSWLSSGADVYWYDSEGTVFVERQEDGRVVELQRADSSSGSTYEAGLGLAANADRVFVGYGYQVRGNDRIEILPPGRLFSLAKQGGQSELLLELDDQWLAPIMADAERVIVFAQGRGVAGFYQVPLAAPRLEPLALGRTVSLATAAGYGSDAAALFYEGQLVGEDVYWVSPASPSWLLKRGSFDDTEGEVVTQVSARYSVGPGYILTEADLWLPGYYYAGKDVLLRDDSGCRSVRGLLGVALSGLALDAQFAYWVSASGSEPRIDDVRLMRVDLESGALAHLTMPGFTHSGSLRLVGHDETRLILSTSGALVSVRKP